MIRVAVISGKGGTGKTIVTATLAHLLRGEMVLADCDVDAANLGILLAPKRISTKPFYGMPSAVIDPALCTGCGLCHDSCRFHAIGERDGIYSASPVRCEGCGVCSVVCPAGAIRTEPRVCGEVCLSSTPAGLLAHGRLRPGSGNSGLMVHEVRKTALSANSTADFFLIDGPPGTGCPLISTVTGTDAVLVVTEPSVSGLHDLKRVVAVARGYVRRVYVAVNRYDLEESITDTIVQWCGSEAVPVLAKIPFDPAVIDAVRNCRTIAGDKTSPAAQAMRSLAARLEQALAGIGTER